MSQNVTHIPPWTITISQDMIPTYSSSPAPDKSWTFIDAAGHGHFYAPGYPTLVRVVECSMGHGEDCEAEGHWECPFCGEEITPGFKPPPTGPTYIKGMVDAWVDYDDGRGETLRYQAESGDEVELLRRDPVAGIVAVLAHEPVSWEIRSANPGRDECPGPVIDPGHSGGGIGARGGSMGFTVFSYTTTVESHTRNSHR